MGILNRVLTILILIFAIASVISAYLLFQKREQLLKRGDKLAATLSQVVSTLDKGSGTDVGSQIITPQKLSHKKYNKLNSLLPAAVSHAKKIVTQRDQLSDTLAKTATTLEIKNIKAEDFQPLDKYEKAEKDLLTKVEKIQQRNNGIIAEWIAAGEKIGIPVNEQTLKSDEYKSALEKLNTKIEDIKNRKIAYAEQVVKIASSLELPEPSIDSDDYTSALDSNLNAVKDHQQKFVQTKQELADKTKRLKIAQETIKKKEQQLKAKKKEIAALKREIVKWKKFAGVETGSGKKGQQEEEISKAPQNLYKMLKGRVIEVNPKWGFVVIDLGKKSQLKIGKQKKPVDVPLPAKIQMIVARGLGKQNEFVGKLIVSKVFDFCSVCNILDTPNSIPVRVGDVVFYDESIEKRKPVEQIQQKPEGNGKEDKVVEKVKKTSEKAVEEKADDDDDDIDALGDDDDDDDDLLD